MSEKFNTLSKTYFIALFNLFFLTLSNTSAITTEVLPTPQLTRSEMTKTTSTNTTKTTILLGMATNLTMSTVVATDVAVSNVATTLPVPYSIFITDIKRTSTKERRTPLTYQMNSYSKLLTQSALFTQFTHRALYTQLTQFAQFTQTTQYPYFTQLAQTTQLTQTTQFTQTTQLPQTTQTVRTSTIKPTECPSYDCSSCEHGYVNFTSKCPSCKCKDDPDFESKRASLIVAAGILPGLLLLFCICLTVPKVCAANQRRKQRKELQTPKGHKFSRNLVLQNMNTVDEAGGT
ncbi:uncharacterized protein LOC130629419 [Hydractinia symbiolongicarpus]|uniref:uncharacterized protein LOC130629419 n=1 Tax=Hydractinia symbiolongicarpus TaxID=13093 RepID=UPI002549DD12|nr:uncharacterized protein LOC130629419 [Hydractinia symbiolongicarpus]